MVKVLQFSSRPDTFWSILPFSFHFHTNKHLSDPEGKDALQAVYDLCQILS